VVPIASYVALDLASRVTASQARKLERYWLIGGAASMGSGIWSMHFVGMLAYRLPIPMSYDEWITLLSLILPILVSGYALHTVSRGALNVRRLLIGGVLIGVGIVRTSPCRGERHRVGALSEDNALKGPRWLKTVRIFFRLAGPNTTLSFHVIGEIMDTVYPEGASEALRAW